MFISCSAAIALAINNSANKIINSYQSKNSIVGTISFNRENMMKNFEPGSSNRENNIEKFNDIEELNLDELKTYADSSYVSEFYYGMSIGMNSSTLTSAAQSIETITSRSNFPGADIKTRKTENNRINRGTYTLEGYENYDSMKDFIDGNYKITDGTIISDFESLECVINVELATINEIKVGDTIKLVNSNDSSLKYKFVVVGIYEETNNTDTINMYSNSANTIITNSFSINKIMADDDDISVKINPSYIIKDKESIEKFSNELAEKGLDENYQLTTNIEGIEAEIKSVSNLKTFSITFLIITLIIGAVVLLILNMINIRERKYEIGVLRTIGMRKSYLTLQFLFELLVVAIFALTLGATMGSFVSVPTANYLLKEEIASAEEEKKSVNENFGNYEGFTKRNANNFKEVKQINEVSEIKAVVDINVLMQLLLIGIGITFISEISAVFSISKFSPLTILKERS